MDDLLITSNANNIKLSDNVYGFSGLLDNKETDCVLSIKESQTKVNVLIYQKKANKIFHLPQDSVGICAKKNEIIFGIADGVTIVNGSQHNDSGVLSYNLVRSIDSLEEKSFEEYVSLVSYKFVKDGHIGASTVILGKLSLTENMLKVFIIGNPTNTGITKYIVDERIFSINNTSDGFLPKQYFSHEEDIVLSKNYSIILSTDGIVVNNRTLYDFVLINKRRSVDKETIELIKNKVNFSSDDQSLLVISRSS